MMSDTQNDREPDHKAVGIGVPPGLPTTSDVDDAEPSEPLDQEQSQRLPEAAEGDDDRVDDLATAAAEERNEGSGGSHEEVAEDLRDRMSSLGDDASEEETDELARQIKDGDESPES